MREERCYLSERPGPEKVPAVTVQNRAEYLRILCDLYSWHDSYEVCHADVLRVRQKQNRSSIKPYNLRAW